MTVSVVAGAEDIKRWKSVRQAGSLHFEAYCATILFGQTISLDHVLHDFIPRCHKAIVNYPGISILDFFAAVRNRLYSQRCRLCSGSNQPPLTHHPGCSPSYLGVFPLVL
jgi:hypothetical protein